MDTMTAGAVVAVVVSAPVAGMAASSPSADAAESRERERDMERFVLVGLAKDPK
jgi:hypothetical protein